MKKHRITDAVVLAQRRFKNIEKARDKARTELHAAIVEAVQGGMSKSEAARRSGYTREHVTKIVKGAE